MNHYCCAISRMQTYRMKDVRESYALAYNPTEPTEHREASTEDTAPDEQRKERICRRHCPSLRKQSCDIGTGTCDEIANRRSGSPFCNSNEQSRIHVINPPSFYDCFCCAARDLNPRNLRRAGYRNRAYIRRSTPGSTTRRARTGAYYHKGKTF